ncbi:helix-turn-helix domain-containing protein [Clostridium aciditolerans]|uniref:Helix-turn-helix domain-containing protein n=1 Tax=Clostridium aciditolerans TaxID=339861 RepID=A0A934HUJ5_9CLOT|nr:helix-turn-helix domain-containing protein [Clostridium aciditolerans]MBI6874550.1 helix-turn-helix domain-containing protein [Clostridium aciditolerans]
MENKFYTIDQVAEMLGMHHKTIRKFITEGRLIANKVGKQWRISGHDLSLFLEKNDEKFDAKKINKEQGVSFSTISENVEIVESKINVSTVVDINEIDMDEYMRISNMLLAVMNCKDSEMKKSTINMKHNKEEKRLRIMLWGSLKFIENMLSTISILVETNNL